MALTRERQLEGLVHPNTNFEEKNTKREKQVTKIQGHGKINMCGHLINNGAASLQLSHCQLASLHCVRQLPTNCLKSGIYTGDKLWVLIVTGLNGRPVNFE